MSVKMFRKLSADEIDVRVSTINENGCSLLLYKDSRVDQNILDETVGPMNWQRRHCRDNANCEVGIWDKDKEMWIWKEDTGTESYTEKEKGLASDSFKRACFNWGIGRELYTAPFIWIPSKCVTIKEKNGKKTTYDKFVVRDIGYDGDKISHLEIYNETIKKVVWSMGTLQSAPANGEEKKATPEGEKAAPRTPTIIPAEADKNKKAVKGQLDQIKELCNKDKAMEIYIAGLYKKSSIDDLTMIQAYSVINSFDRFEERYKKEIPFN